MSYNRELLKKVEKALNAEELYSILKENGIPVTLEEAGDIYRKINDKNTRLSDDELSVISGGACSGTRATTPMDPIYLPGHVRPIKYSESGHLIVSWPCFCYSGVCRYCSIPFDAKNASECHGCKRDIGCGTCSYSKPYPKGGNYTYECLNPAPVY